MVRKPSDIELPGLLAFCVGASDHRERPALGRLSAGRFFCPLRSGKESAMSMTTGTASDRAAMTPAAIETTLETSHIAQRTLSKRPTDRPPCDPRAGSDAGGINVDVDAMAQAEQPADVSEDNAAPSEWFAAIYRPTTRGCFPCVNGTSAMKKSACGFTGCPRSRPICTSLLSRRIGARNATAQQLGICPGPR